MPVSPSVAAPSVAAPSAAHSGASLARPAPRDAAIPEPAHAHPAGHAHHHPAVRIGASVLRLSLAARLALATAFLAPLWIAVFLVAGGAP